MSAQPRTFGLPPARRIIAIVRKPFGDHGGHILVCELACGHKVEHLNNGVYKPGRRTRCEECR